MGPSARRLPFALALAVGLGSGGAAHATPVTVALTGTWSRVTDPALLLDGSITVGGAWSARLTLETSIADENPLPSVGSYTFAPDELSLTFSTGSYTFLLGPSAGRQVGVQDGGATTDNLLIYAEQFGVSGSLPPGSFLISSNATFRLSDSTNTAHSSDALGDLPWSAQAYDSTSFVFFGDVYPSGFLQLEGAVTAIAVVPEPVSAQLLALGLSGLAAYRRRRSRGRA